MKLQLACVNIAHFQRVGPCVAGVRPDTCAGWVQFELGHLPPLVLHNIQHGMIRMRLVGSQGWQGGGRTMAKWREDGEGLVSCPDQPARQPWNHGTICPCAMDSWNRRTERRRSGLGFGSGGRNRKQLERQFDDFSARASAVGQWAATNQSPRDRPRAGTVDGLASPGQSGIHKTALVVVELKSLRVDQKTDVMYVLGYPSRRYNVHCKQATYCYCPCTFRAVLKGEDDAVILHSS
jgi:hypothetical protein